MHYVIVRATPSPSVDVSILKPAPDGKRAAVTSDAMMHQGDSPHLAGTVDLDHTTAATAGASFHGRNTPGISRLVVDEDRRLLVGATFTASEVAEFLHAATIAVVGEVPLELLWHAVPSFPTRSEIWLRRLEAYGM